MVAEKVLITFAYDTWKGLLGSVLKDRDHEEAVSDAASIAASSTDGISEDDLLDVFKAELDEDVLKTTGVEEIKSKLANALKIRANTHKEVDYETVVTQFLDELEQNIVAQGRPEDGVQVLYEYARETNHLAEDLQDEIRRLHREYYDDLTTLSNRSSRVVPGKDQYRLPGIDKHIEQPATSAIKKSIADGENVILTGSAGVGKSGVLAELYHTWDKEQTIYFLDAREFGGIDSKGDIESELGLRNRIRDVFGRIAENSSGCVLLVDQLDNVLTERDVPNIFEHLLLDLAGIDNITVVCACRDWDLNQQEYQGLQETDDFFQKEVEPLTNEQIQRILPQLGIEEAVQNEHLIELCQSLLNLSLLADIVAQNGDVDAGTITEKITLWEKYRESLDKEGSGVRGQVPRDWDESPVDRAVRHARSSLEERKTTFSIDDRDPGDQRLLSRGTIEQEWRQRHRFRHDQLQSYFYAWNATADDLDIKDVLEDGVNELVAADVFEWMLQFYLERPSRSASFVRDTLGSSSELGFYARAVIANTAGSLSPEKLGENVARAVVESLNTDPRLAREFYRELEAPDWANFLIEQSLLSESGVPEAEYIARFVDTRPAIVIDALKNYESIDLYQLYPYLSVLDKLPRQKLAIAVLLVAEWIRDFDSQDIERIQTDLIEIAEVLVEAGQPDATIELISVMTEPISFETEEKERGGATVNNQQIQSRVEPRTLKKFFQQHSRQLAKSCKHAIVDELEGNFWTCLELLGETLREGTPLVKAINRQRLFNSTEINDLEEVLLYALERILCQRLTTEPDAGAQRLKGYLQEGGIFRQAAVNLLGKNPAKAPDMVARLLTNRDNYEDRTITTDFIRLLHKGFEHLSDEDQQQVIQRLKTGPDREQIWDTMEYILDTKSESEISEEVESRIERWKLKRLYHIRHLVSNKEQEYLEELSNRHGDVVFSPDTGFRFLSSSNSEEENIVSAEARSTDEFLSLCREYSEDSTGEYTGDVIAEPRSKLAKELSDRIRSKPGVYLPRTPALIETGDKALAKKIFSAVDTLITNEDYHDITIENWDAVIEASIQFCNQEPLEESWPRDCRQVFARMVRTIIGHARSTLDVEKYAEELHEILLALLSDPNPETRGSARTLYATVTPPRTQGVRSTGAIATVHFFRVQARAPYDALSRYQKLWKRLQGLATDDAERVRTALGTMLFSIYKLDNNFENFPLDELLPENTDSARVSKFEPAWEGYISKTDFTEDLFHLLRSRYQQAITLHKEFDSELHDQTFRFLCSDFAIAYTHSYISYDDALLNETVTITAEELNLENPTLADRHFIRAFDGILENTDDRNLEKEYWERIMDFWERRLADVDGNLMQERQFGEYARMLEHSPPSVTVSDVAEQLKQTAPSVDSWYPFTTILEFLADEVKSTTRSKDLDDAIEILSELIEHYDFIRTPPAADERWIVVKKVAEDGNSLALEVAESLFEHGEPEYQRIIDEHKVNSE